MRDGKGFCVVAGVDEPGEAVALITDPTLLSNYTDAKAASKKVSEMSLRK